MIIQPSGSLGNLAESEILDVIFNSYVEEPSDRVDGCSEQSKIAYCKCNVPKVSVVLLIKCPEPFAG